MGNHARGPDRAGLPADRDNDHHLGAPGRLIPWWAITGLALLLALVITTQVINAVATNRLLDQVHILNAQVCAVTHHQAGLSPRICFQRHR
jgi:hypothetical protein